MGQSKSIIQNGIQIEKFSQQNYCDELINQQFSSTIMILEDFINFYKDTKQIHLKILEKLLQNICIEEECLKRLKITLDEEKNEFFYNENLFRYKVALKTIHLLLSQKKLKSEAQLEDAFTEATQMLIFKKELFFTYPFYFFLELLKFSIVHIIIVHFISINKTDIFQLYQKYYFLLFHQLLDGLLARISMVMPSTHEIYSKFSKKLRNAHEINVQYFEDKFSNRSYLVRLQDDTTDSQQNYKSIEELDKFRVNYINQILIGYGQTRVVQLIKIFDQLSQALNCDKIDYKEVRKQLQNEQEEFHLQINSTIPQFLKSIEEVIYMKNTQKKEIHSLKKQVNEKNLEYLFTKLEKIQKEFNPMETNSINNQNGNDTLDDSVSKVSHIFSNKHLNIYNHYSRQLIMEDESGFKIRVNQALQVLDEQIQECEETIEDNKEYKKQYKIMLNQVIHKIHIFNLIEKKCLLKDKIQ
ncbi:hypothetical protein ABPG74_014182 [Tetrahymena malaccensis]